MIDQQTILLWKAELADAPQSVEAIRLRTALDALEEATQKAEHFRQAALARIGAENRSERLMGTLRRVRTMLGEWRGDLEGHLCHELPNESYAAGECAGERKIIDQHIRHLTMVVGDPIVQVPLRDPITATMVKAG